MFLKADRINTAKIGGETLTINEKIIPDGARATKNIAGHIPQGGLVKPNKKLGFGNIGFPEGITVHNTDVISTPTATNPAEQYTRATYPNGNMGGVVVHFYVYKREIWQNLHLDEQGWHAADGATRRTSQRQGKIIGGNLDTIAIEVVGNDPETEKTAAVLTAWLCSLYGFDPKLDVYTHKYFYSAKNCPIWLIPRWEWFKNAVAEYLSGAVPVSPTAPTPQPNPIPNPTLNPVPISKTVQELAAEVLAGKWGNDPERTRQLTAAGYDARAVQTRVNEILRGQKPSETPPPPPPPLPIAEATPALEQSPIKSAEEVALEIWRGQGGWGFDPERKEKLIAYGGSEFRNAVQKRVNEIACSV